MSTRVLLVLAASVAWLPAARGEMVVQWWGGGGACRHKAMTVQAGTEAGTHLLKFDLSALKAGTTVYRAALRVQTRVPPARTDKRAYMNIGRGVFYYDPLRLYAQLRPDRPIEIYPSTGTDGYDKNAALKLIGPQFQSFDATSAVRGWVAKGGAAAFLVRRLDRWVPDRTVLEIAFEGKVTDPPPQASGLKVVHRKGQSFITWVEAEKIISDEPIAWKDFETAFKAHGPRKGTFYRIYRHDKPITAVNLHQAHRIDEIWPLSGYDARLHQHWVRGENWVGLDGTVRVTRYVINDPPAGTVKANDTYGKTPQWHGGQLPLHTGLYVHQPAKAGKAYYAVTTCAGGAENTRDLTAANALSRPVAETVGAGEPVLYRVMPQYIGHGRARKIAETQFFVYWAAPPYANQPRRPIHVLVGLVGPEPSAQLRTRLSMRNMYGNEIIRGTHPREWRGDLRVLTVLCDGSYMTKGYYDSWNTLRPKRKPSTYQPYAERLAKMLEPWAKKLAKRWPVQAR